MTNSTHNTNPAEQRRRLAQAYNTLRRSIYWDRHAARAEWTYDNCRYPLRNYYKHGTTEISRPPGVSAASSAIKSTRQP